MEMIAHLTKVNGSRKEETLKEHCLKTAVYAVQSVESGEYLQNILRGQLTDEKNFQFKRSDFYFTVYVSGLLHDMGKAKQEYIQYIEKAFRGEKVIKGSVNHTFAGVQWIMEKFHTEVSSPWEKITSEIISFAVGSHHGMFDCVKLDGDNGFVYRQQKDKKELCYEEVLQNYFEQVIEEEKIVGYFQKAVDEVKKFYNTLILEYGKSKSAISFQMGMLARLVLSAVIYGDRRDTSEFMSQRKIVVNNNITWENSQSYFESELKNLDSVSAINQVRREISLQCVKAAERNTGIYQMNIPTGGGKTLSALRYALAHAKIYHKKRIIFIIPLLSVLEQNVKVICDYLPDSQTVLEHHSNIIKEKNIGDDLDKCEFLAESWNSPVVVSTLVQLLNILFSHQTSAVGRMQALCDSVIVIDEVQTLPRRMTLMFNMALNFLQKYCNTTVLLSSATQPCFEELKWPLHLAEKPNLVQLNKQQLAVFRRSKIVVDRNHPYGMDWDDCTSFCSGLMEKHNSLLIVCNTKSEARTLFKRMKKQARWQGWAIYHLSASMCQVHRMDVLEKIQEKLSVLQNRVQEKNDIQKVICIATQVVEAGIDISFEGGVRVLAGIDNLVQAAGRSNRSNEYGFLGIVYLICLKNEKLGPLPDIKMAQICTRKLLDNWNEEIDGSIIEGEAVRKYYQYLYQETEKEIEYPVEISGELFYMSKLLANQNVYGNTMKNRNYFFHQPFKTVGKNFKVFDENTIDVLVPYGEGIRLIKKLKALTASDFQIEETRELIQQAKLYSISIFEWQKKKLEEAELLTSLWDGRLFILNEKAYDDSLGCISEEE